MGYIVDISHHNTVNWATASQYLDLAIIRVQYGSNTVDRKYKDFVAGCKQYGVPFGHYAYALFVSVEDARVEARDFMKRADKDAKFLVVDVEELTIKGRPDLMLPATQAYVDELRKEGWKVGLYTGHHVWDEFRMDKVDADFVWVPRYAAGNSPEPIGPKPKMRVDIWQYTEYGNIPGIQTRADVNMLLGDKTLDWYIGKQPVVPPSVAPGTDELVDRNAGLPIGRVKVTGTGVRLRKEPSTNSAIVNPSLDRIEYLYYGYVKGEDGYIWWNLGPGWVRSDVGGDFIPGGAVITATVLNVRTGPGTNFPVKKQLKNGAQVRLWTRQGDWYCSDNDEWIHGAYITVRDKY